MSTTTNACVHIHTFMHTGVHVHAWSIGCCTAALARVESCFFCYSPSGIIGQQHSHMHSCIHAFMHTCIHAFMHTVAPVPVGIIGQQHSQCLPVERVDNRIEVVRHYMFEHGNQNTSGYICAFCTFMNMHVCIRVKAPCVCTCARRQAHTGTRLT